MISLELERALDAFLARRYEDMQPLTVPLLEREVALEPAHLLLTSMMRLGRRQHAETVWESLHSYLHEPWERSLLALCLDERGADGPPPGVSTEVADQWLYHSAASDISHLRLDPAVIKLNDYCQRNRAMMDKPASFEATLVRTESNYLVNGWSCSDLDSDLLDMHDRVVQLVNSGDFSRALVIAQLAYDEGSRRVGSMHGIFVQIKSLLARLKVRMGEAKPEDVCLTLGECADAVSRLTGQGGRSYAYAVQHWAEHLFLARGRVDTPDILVEELLIKSIALLLDHLPENHPTIDRMDAYLREIRFSR